MLYELRCYKPAAGREDDLRRRFAHGTIDLFARLGYEVVDFWEHASGNGELYYLMKWKDEDAMEQAWASFRQNPEWLAMKAQSERDGPLTRSITSIPLRRAEFFNTEIPSK